MKWGVYRIKILLMQKFETCFNIKGMVFDVPIMTPICINRLWAESSHIVTYRDFLSFVVFRGRKCEILAIYSGIHKVKFFNCWSLYGNMMSGNRDCWRSRKHVFWAKYAQFWPIFAPEDTFRVKFRKIVFIERSTEFFCIFGIFWFAHIWHIFLKICAIGMGANLNIP